MRKYVNLGLKIREARKSTGHTLAFLANKIGIDNSHLSMIETGLRRPSENILQIIADQYSLDFQQLRVLADYEENNTANRREEVKIVESNQEVVAKDIQIRVPDTLQVLYSDSAFITSGPYGLVFDFAQKLGSTTNENVVARIGLSVQHAKAFLKILSQKILDAERVQEEQSKELIKKELTRN